MSKGGCEPLISSAFRSAGCEPNIRFEVRDMGAIIVDEPTAGLDPEERVRFRNLLSGLGGDRVVLLSTHIVEDVAQTSRNLAVLVRGRALYAGTASGLIESARGRVFEVETDGSKPEGSFVVVATLHLGDATRYRAVGEPPEHLKVREVSPSLEDGYVWLMRSTGRLTAGAA